MTDLPYGRVYQLLKSMKLSAEAHAKVMKLTSLLLKQVRMSCAIVFLLACLSYNVTPKFIESTIKLPSWVESTKALERKTASLKTELIRQNISINKQKSFDFNRDISYEYLNVIRSDMEVQKKKKILELLEEAITQETSMIFDRHARKWTWWTGHSFPCVRSSYDSKHKCRFVFHHVDDFWFSGSSSSVHILDHFDSNRLTNETKIVVPNDIKKFLSNGPKFRLPHHIDDDFLNDNEIAIESLSYKLRWSHHFNSRGKNNENNENKLQIPFDKNTVNFPPNMSKDLEDNLKLFEIEAKRTLHAEATKMKRNKKYNSVSNISRKTKSFLKRNKLNVVPSDKSNRLVICDEDSLKNRTENLLQDTSTYKIRDISKNSAIENQANNLIRSKCSKLYGIDHEKLLVSGTHPAKFLVNIKDHKEKVDGSYPLRPIASIHGTPTQKVDWLASVILNQLVKFVPAHISSTNSLINEMNNNADIRNCDNDKILISLDVKNLYPSIPINDGIREIENFATQHWNKINSYGLSVEDLMDCLKFVSYNYEITYNEKTYLQIKGCPMGTHFSPPFAIIYMNSIEQTALEKLNNDNVCPTFYKRYIDDIILGPFSRDSNLLSRILNTFNSINDNIQFTVEIPTTDNLNFLDISISVSKKLTYKWYSKPCHSNISLRKDSWLPNYVKHNFVKSSLDYVVTRCSDQSENSIQIMRNRLIDNGFRSRDFYHKNKNKTHNAKNNSITSMPTLSLGFVGESFVRKINKIKNKYDIPVRITSKPGRKLATALQQRNVNKCTCDICNNINPKYNCKSKHIVYDFECKLCNQNYIGQTCRPFHVRYKEHERSLKNEDKKSALSDHSLKYHRDRVMTINDFSYSILDQQQTAITTRVAESRCIATNKPQINRRQEVTS